MRAMVILTVALVCFGFSPAHAFSLFGGSMETVTAKDATITLDTSGLKSGQSKHYVYKEGKTTIRFFLVRDNRGSVRAALDACEACWRADKGYTLRDGTMLCVNCGMKFALSRIGEVRGGCNPHPVAFTLEAGRFIVTTQELLSGAHYFPGNSR